ncbi:HAMP domain-containing histidine kinase (plasmid) [Nostoc sp. C052]|uniref:sensor histidine kinase n=1 Tax=Nostoc sp. C052 TaxID=2576902 RepID=UPI0015C3191B|nr:HAMP domain-containing sensor histidine kinase [Nostoc sp. C052]QLE45371.1 HAMP domain-containing histidine kinase [Nostoc sp. C052]
MLHEFLLAERNEILALCSKKIARLADSMSSSDEMERGLPVFYDELIEVLRADADIDESGEAHNNSIESVHRAAAERRGKESLKLGYSISQVVHGYGALCQAITEYIQENTNQTTSPREFNRLNFCLDIAIAEAVTEFNRGQRENAERDEVLRLGFLAHELRNALTSASLASQLIITGKVGANGSTSRILENAHRRMRDIIDRSLVEVRLRNESTGQYQRCRVIHLVSEVEATAWFEASAKSIEVCVEVAPELEVLIDRHLIISALSNLVQNAIKFTKQGGIVWIRGKAVGGRVLLEIEDQCGGLPPGEVEELFKAFSQMGTDRSGLGIGLTISRRAVSLNKGVLSVRDIPHQGCVFSIDLPKASSPLPTT